MPYVDGDNLEKFAKRRDFSFIIDGLPILLRVADTVREAHNLPECVLHRDLRPSNIIIRNGRSGELYNERVVVLDFDLCWHEGADTDSPISPSMTTVLGYLAPEQITHELSTHARSSKVDTFGMCMTVYFLFQGNIQISG